MKITVFGATGMLGVPVTKTLAERGHDITVLVRDGKKARALFGDQVHIIQGDLRTPAAIGLALKHAEGVYCNLSVKPESRHNDFQPEREGLQAILDACKRQGNIRYFGYTSSLVQQYEGMRGFHWWTFAVKNQALESIRRSGLPYHIYRASNFMDNFEQGNYRRGRYLLLAGTSEHPMYFIASSDYARQVCRAVASHAGSIRDYAIQGPEALTADEAANLYAAHYRPQRLRVLKLPMILMKPMRNLHPVLHYGYHIIEALNHYPETFEASTTWQELGAPFTTLQKFAGNHV